MAFHTGRVTFTRFRVIGDAPSDAPTRLLQAHDALCTGKWPRKAGLILSDGESHWELTLQADALTVHSAALPEITDAQSPRELIETRLDHIEGLAKLLDCLFDEFLSHRAYVGWPDVVAEIKAWIKTKAKASSPRTGSHVREVT